MSLGPDQATMPELRQLQSPCARCPALTATLYLQACARHLEVPLTAPALAIAGGQAAGYAAADSVQALPLVSTFWGILLFGEYRRCSKRTLFLLIAMLAMFAAAVGLLMGSSGDRKTD